MPGRVLGVDLGSKRIGIALSDSKRTVATPHGVVGRSPDPSRHRAEIAALVTEWDVALLVVGLPLSLDGSHGPAAEAALAEARALGDATALPVETYDERLTTVTAERTLIEQGLTAPERRRVVDQVAAAVLLQAWIDAQPPRSGHV